jgi:hypothetical protein
MALPISIRETFRENWPASIVRLAVPAKSLQLFPHEIDFLGQWQPTYKRYFAPIFCASCPSLEQRLAEHLTDHGVYFPRLSFCSWKDATRFNRPCRTLEDILAWLRRADERIDKYLVTAKSDSTPVWLHLMDWRKIEDYDEVRVFFKDRRIVGVSAYAEDAKDPISAERANRIVESLLRIEATLTEALHLDPVIVDCLISKTQLQTIELLELNPFSALSSAAQFSWDEKFAREFRSQQVRLKF